MEWLAGAMVRRGGVYRVTHRGHRPTHDAILQQGDVFPVCRKCGMAVSFEFVQPLSESEEVEHIGYDRDFMESVLPAYAQSA
jgi:hypothetical protein